MVGLMSVLRRRVDLSAHRQPPYLSSLNPSITVYYSASVFASFIDEVLGGALLLCGLDSSVLFERLVATGLSDLINEFSNNTGECGFSFSLGHVLTLGKCSNSGSNGSLSVSLGGSPGSGITTNEWLLNESLWVNEDGFALGFAFFELDGIGCDEGNSEYGNS